MRHGRRIFIAALALLSLLLAQQGLLAQSVDPQPAGMPPEALSDAALHDIFFLDAGRGWAVGDRGVIWRTDNGGRHWQMADSPVNCSLHSIHFIDQQYGWIVGGWTHPYSHRTSGVVLRTENGGRRWTQVRADTLPKLAHVEFFDQRRGWAVGKPSAMYPAGVFRTEDGGRSWSSFATEEHRHWIAADFIDINRGIVVGRDGAAAVVGATAVQPLAKPNTGLRHFGAVHSLNNHQTILAGDGGLLLVTEDAGRSWQTPELPLSKQVVDNIDFRAIASVDNVCWIAGNPGSCLFRSTDHGRSWQLFTTGQPLPIHAMTFINAQRGWAVGPLGMILATSDGGETWLTQRSGGRRAAMLGLFAEASDVSLEMFTRYCGDEGYLGVVETLTRRDVEVASVSSASTAQRLSAGVLAAGGSYANTTWRFPLRQAGMPMTATSIARGWSLTNGTDGAAALEEYLVLRIRQWRPDVILTRATDPRHLDSLTQLTSQSILRAAERAADPSAYPEQITILGLESWQVKKIGAVASGKGSGAIVLDTSQLATRLGQSIEQHAAQNYALLREQWSPVPRQQRTELLMSQVPAAVANRDLFSGIVIPYSSDRSVPDARRAEGHPQLTSLAEMRRVTRTRGAVERMLTRADTDALNLAAWSAQVDELIRGLRPRAGGDVLFQLAQHYRELGRYELACESLQQLLRKYPTHSLAESAISWCVEYLASEEVGTAFGMQPAVASHVVQQASAERNFNAAFAPTLQQQVPVTRYDSRATQAGFNASIATTDPLDRLLFQIEQLQQVRPTLFAESNIRFAVASAYRRRGQLSTATRLYQHVANSQPSGAWRQAARGELWLKTRTGNPPKPMIACLKIDEKPFLDGKLDEKLWATATQAELKSQLGDDVDWPATIKLARDDEYLYFGIRCRKIRGQDYTATDDSRRRDPDLSNSDRVELLLDTNRDYTSCIKLSVDHRGWTGEAVWGDARWNPKWFVASHVSSDHWTVEAAIPLVELGHEQIANGEVWACGIQRVVPGVGFQSWTPTASVAGSPAGFGFLSFD